MSYLHDSFRLGVVILLLCAGDAASGPILWLSPVNGSWEDPAAWDLLRVPGLPGDEPTLGLSGAYTVRSQANSFYSMLHIPNPDASLVLLDSAHTVQSGVSNSGLIQIGDPTSAAVASFRFNGTSEITGPGILRLNATIDPTQARLFALFQPLHQAEEHTIDGNGELVVTSIENDGLIQATGQLGLRLLGSYTQSSTGRIGADGGRLLLGEQVMVQGGTLYSQNSGLILLDGDAVTLQEVTIDGEFTHGAGDHHIFIRGSVVNNGTLTLSSDLSDGQLTIMLDDASSLQGDGTLRLVGDASGGPNLTVEDDAVASIGAGLTVEIGSRVSIPTNSSITLDGVMRTLAGINPITVQGDLAGSGVLSADQNDILLKQDTTLTGLTLTTSGDHRFLIDQGTVVFKNGVHNTGLVQLGDDLERLDIRGEFINDGVVLIGDPQIDEISLLRLYDRAEINGAGVIGLGSHEGAYAIMSVLTGTATIGPDQTVMGHGEIRTELKTKLVNRGTIRSSDTTYPLVLKGWQLSEGGRYISAGAGLLLDSCILQDAVIETDPAGGEIACESVRLTNTTVLDSLRVRGDGGQAIYTNLGIAGEVMNQRQIILEGGAGMLMNLGARLRGPGEVLMYPGSLISSEGFTGILPRIESGVVVRGAGRIEYRGVLGGDLIADDPDHPMELDANIQFDGGRLIADGAEIRFDRSSELSGGEFVSVNGGSFRQNQSASIDATDLTNSGTVYLESALFRTTLTNAGQIYIIPQPYDGAMAGVIFEDSCSVNGSGQLVLQTAEGQPIENVRAITRVSSITTLGAQQSLVGSGRLEGSFKLLGEIEPSGVYGRIQVRDAELGPTTILRIELGGVEPGTYGQIQMLPAGSLMLSGKLSVMLAAGFEPALGDQWEIISQQADKLPAKIGGQFDEIQLPEPPKGRRYVLHQDDSGMRLVSTCLGDTNGDGLLDFFDVSLFVTQFSMLDPLSDINKDGSINFFDVSLFITAYLGGCS